MVKKMSAEKNVLKTIKKKIDKYTEESKQITILNNLNLEISQFYQKDDGTIELSSKSLKIKEEDIVYEIFANGILLKIEERSKEAYGATGNKPHCTPNI
jgi:hypothetical protein